MRSELTGQDSTPSPNRAQRSGSKCATAPRGRKRTDRRRTSSLCLEEGQYFSLVGMNPPRCLCCPPEHPAPWQPPLQTLLPKVPSYLSKHESLLFLTKNPEVSSHKCPASHFVSLAPRGLPAPPPWLCPIAAAVAARARSRGPPGTSFTRRTAVTLHPHHPGPPLTTVEAKPSRHGTSLPEIAREIEEDWVKRHLKADPVGCLPGG